MKFLKFTFSILFIFVFFVSFSQERSNEDNSQTTLNSEIYNYRQTVSDFLQISQVQSVTGQRNASTNTQNSINVSVIQQVGTANQVLTNTVSGVSNLQYFQSGNRNSINSINTTFNATENVLQSGINNNVTNFSFGSVNTATLNVVQTGNNLNFEKFGSNAQTNSLKFRMTGNNKTITVRSF